MDVIRLKVFRCARCRGNHDEPVEFRPLDFPTKDWSYWGACPANGQPIMLAVHSDNQHRSHSDLLEQLHAPEEGASAVAHLPPAGSSVLDQIIAVTNWDGSGSLAEHVRRLVARRDFDRLHNIARAVINHARQFTELGVQHGLHDVALELADFLRQQ